MAIKTATVIQTPPKISVKIWRPIIEKLDKKIEAACLRRDAYLNRVLETELPELDREVSIPSSPVAQAFIAARLDELDRKLVSLTLRPDLVQQLNEICERKRIVRDAFFNRVFLLLATGSKQIDALFFGDYADEWRRKVWSEYRNEGPFFQNGFSPLDPAIDPFWAIRVGLELYPDGKPEEWTEPETGKTIQVQRDLFSGGVYPLNSVYTDPFGQQFKNVDLTGMNCYLPDWKVPGSEAAAARQKELDEILSLDL